MRTKAQIHCLTGHTNTVAVVKAQAADPEVSFTVQEYNINRLFSK